MAPLTSGRRPLAAALADMRNPAPRRALPSGQLPARLLARCLATPSPWVQGLALPSPCSRHRLPPDSPHGPRSGVDPEALDFGLYDGAPPLGRRHALHGASSGQPDASGARQPSSSGDEGSHSDGSDDDDGARPPARPARDPEPRLLMRGELHEPGPLYAGRKASRRALEQGAGDGEDGDGDEGEDAGAEEEDEGQEGEEGEEEEDGGAGSTSRMHAAGARVAEDEELAQLSREYEQLQQEEEQMLMQVQRQGAAHVEKGKAVAQQQALWERILEIRIALQKCLNASNRLPLSDTMKALCKADGATDVALSKLAVAAKDTVNLLMDLQEALIEQNPAVQAAAGQAVEGGQPPPDIPGIVPNHLDDLWRQLTSLYSRTHPFCSAAIDRWQQKGLLSSGSHGKLCALNQSVSQQVAGAMLHPQRLIARSQLRALDARILGQADQVVVEAESEDGNPDTFDDGDFYTHLLSEFLETSSAAAGIRDLGGDRVRSSKRKVVDRRASKGRKIRYTVHQPLVNFMAPEPREIPPLADSLFAGLFSQAAVARSV
eukprot:SM000161S02446  [mRNA]  locus=s161:194004:197538:- [translate_table: standard]